MIDVPRKPSLAEAFIPIIFLIVALSVNVAVFGDAGLDGSNQIVLILSSGVAALVAARLGFNWEEMQDGAVKNITSAMPSILILLLIGALAGTWMISGNEYSTGSSTVTMFFSTELIACSVVYRVLVLLEEVGPEISTSPSDL